MIWHLLSRDRGSVHSRWVVAKGAGTLVSTGRLLGTNLNAAFRRHADNPSNGITSE